jgi:hypothetical protein
MLCHHRPIRVPSHGEVGAREQTYCGVHLIVPRNTEGWFKSQDPFVNKNRLREVAVPFSEKEASPVRKMLSIFWIRQSLYMRIT